MIFNVTNPPQRTNNIIDMRFLQFNHLVKNNLRLLNLAFFHYKKICSEGIVKSEKAVNNMQ